MKWKSRKKEDPPFYDMKNLLHVTSDPQFIYLSAVILNMVCSP